MLVARTRDAMRALRKNASQATHAPARVSAMETDMEDVDVDLDVDLDEGTWQARDSAWLRSRLDVLEDALEVRSLRLILGVRVSCFGGKIDVRFQFGPCFE